jgi:site-specific recombinase XerD
VTVLAAHPAREEAASALDNERVIVVEVPMLTIQRGVDLWLDDLRARGYSGRTIDRYERCLNKLIDMLSEDTSVKEITTDDVRRFRGRWTRQRGSGQLAEGTRATQESALASLFRWLYDNDKIARNPMDKLERTRRLPPDSLDVVTVSTTDVRRMLEASHKFGLPERLTMYVLVYTGARREAVNQLRWLDYDQARGRIRFKEKGRRTIWKPVADALAVELNDAFYDLDPSPEDWLVPPASQQRRGGTMDGRRIWKNVKRVAEEAGVECHVHALRAAFAVFYLEEHDGNVLALQALMGHRQLATTQVYLRKMDRDLAMDSVRDMSWGVV